MSFLTDLIKWSYRKMFLFFIEEFQCKNFFLRLVSEKFARL